MNFYKLIYTILLLAVSHAWAAGQSAIIEVQDEKNQALPGATIMMNETNSERSFAGVTDQDGKAVFGDLSTGMYVITIQFLDTKRLKKPSASSKTRKILSLT